VLLSQFLPPAVREALDPTRLPLLAALIADVQAAVGNEVRARGFVLRLCSFVQRPPSPLPFPWPLAAPCGAARSGSRA
jgi:hypothetical protein